MELKKTNSYSIEQLYVGQKDHITRTASLEDIKDFSKLTGDYHPLHFDREYSIKNGFKDIIAHGLLLSSFSSALVGMKLPGKRTIIMRQTFDYLAPVYPNDLLIITGTVSKVDIRFSIIEMVITIKSNGILMSKGSYTIKIRK